MAKKKSKTTEMGIGITYAVIGIIVGFILYLCFMYGVFKVLFISWEGVNEWLSQAKPLQNLLTLLKS